MKKIVTAAVTALVVSTSIANADGAPTPQMSPEIVTQDSLIIGEDQAPVIVPILFMIFLALIASNGGGAGLPITELR